MSDLHKEIAAGLGKNISISGLEPGTEIDKIIDVLDAQLANGLGSGTGATDAIEAVKKAKHDYPTQHILKFSHLPALASLLGPYFSEGQK